MKVSIREVRNVLLKSLLAKRVPREEAEIVADEYLQGELQGKLSHGLMAFPSLVKKLDKKPKPFKIITKTHSLVLIDAQENLGAYAGRKAADMAIAFAKKEGVGVALIKNQVTWLRPGTLAKYIANQGYVGIVTNNGGKPMTAPPGGYDPVIGTNPLGIGIPTGNEAIVADMATSIRAWGEVRKAEKEGTDLPKGMYYDKQGRFAVRPVDAYSVAASGGYKGFALGLLVEILTGSYLGRLMGAHQMSGDYRTMTRGGVIIVLNPRLTTSLKEFKQSNSRLVGEIKGSKKLAGVEEILLPGERAAKRKSENEKRGYLEIEDSLWKELQSLAK